MIRIASRLADMNGWTQQQVSALSTGTSTDDAKVDALTDLIREAAANSGNVTDAIWKAAQQANWSDKQLADAFAYVGATVFTGYFLNYAQTEAILKGLSELPANCVRYEIERVSDDQILWSGTPEEAASAIRR